MEENTIKNEILLQDSVDAGLLSAGEEDAKQHESNVVSLWNKRFKKSENFRRPFVDKWLRMYGLYRAYREKMNYAYQTSVMPPIGFEIIETIRPRLTAAEVKVNFYPVKKDSVGSPFIKEWDGLIEYDFQEIEFEEKKIQWVFAMLLFANGIAQLSWKGDKPYLEIVDNFLFYPDPQAMNRLKNSRWEIKQIFKDKAILEEEEGKRDESKKLYPLIKNWKEDVENLPQGDKDNRLDRYEINTKKMAQVNKGASYIQDGKDYESRDNDSKTGDKNDDEKCVEIWECWDHVTNKLTYIFNRTTLARETENPYNKIREGRMFFDLPDIVLNWEYYAMGHLEPVETTIIELADSRNQAMDDIVFTLDPIRKLKKGKGIKASDIVHRPGATWELDNANDVLIETPPTISDVWVTRDSLLRKDIQTALALSEYTQGIPRSNQEPASKVETLLNQTNIRLAQNVRQMEIVFSEIVNALIKMNGEFLTEDLAYRITGKKFRFGEFTQAAKNVEVDADVDITTKKEKTADQEANEVLELYKMFVVDDRPEDATNGEDMLQWKKKKSVLQTLVLEKLGYEAYIDKLIPKNIEEQKPTLEQGGNGTTQQIPEAPAEQPGGEMPNQEIPIIQMEDILNTPQAETVESAQAPSGQKQGLLQQLLSRVRGNK